MEAEDETGAKASKQIKVLVCGFETVTILQSQSIKTITTRKGTVQKFITTDMLSTYFSLTDTTNNYCILSSIVVGKIESNSFLPLLLNSDESTVLYLNSDGNVEINLSVYQSLKLTTKFAFTAVSVSSI